MKGGWGWAKSTRRKRLFGRQNAPLSVNHPLPPPRTANDDRRATCRASGLPASEDPVHSLFLVPRWEVAWGLVDEAWRRTCM